MSLPPEPLLKTFGARQFERSILINTVIGSTRLVHSSSLTHGARPRRRVPAMIDPIILGSGSRLFVDDGTLQSLRLVDIRVTTTGAILATYAVAD